MSRCEEFCRAAPDCTPCALDAELDRVSRGRIPAYVEGSDSMGRWARLNDRFVRRAFDD